MANVYCILTKLIALYTFYLFFSNIIYFYEYFVISNYQIVFMTIVIVKIAKLLHYSNDLSLIHHWYFKIWHLNILQQLLMEMMTQVNNDDVI